MQLYERQKLLSALLLTLPERYDFRYPEEARRELIQQLFLSLCGNNQDFTEYLFPNGLPSSQDKWSLSESQGAVDGAEYTEAARGHACGHIFKSGEASYRCKTCTDDSTCVLCARCFHASDHEGHVIYISLSNGHSGCCDCGDPEAWRIPVSCSIHSIDPTPESHAAGKAKVNNDLPLDLVHSIQMTITKCMDYLVDVWSCSPEQLRAEKTEESVLEDERLSRLSPELYGGADPAAAHGELPEFAVVLWNDEKHTIEDVTEIVARACRTTKIVGRQKADIIDNVGRAILKYSTNIEDLLKAAKIIEQPKLSVSVRSARDIVREEMCGTIVSWLGDIAGCKVGTDTQILRRTICEEFMAPWTVGSSAHYKLVGQDGLYDHDREDIKKDLTETLGAYGTDVLATLERTWGTITQQPQVGEEDALQDFEANEDDEDIPMDPPRAPIEPEITLGPPRRGAEDVLEGDEATLAGYPPPPPPTEVLRQRGAEGGVEGGSEIEIEDPSDSSLIVPKTPLQALRPAPKPPGYWLEKPDDYGKQDNLRPAEDLWHRVRLDYLVLYELRMWKQLRIDLREILISTIITLPDYKRLLGLRISSIYTVLAELHLIADREPDHSIIYLSLQMLTTPSIAMEIVQKANFLTNLLAILYTFLTTRQVGYPGDVNLTATLALDQGVVFNRRASSFYHDMKLIAGLDGIRDMIRLQPRYLLQFLDLAKVHQGVCPTVRAVGEHVEYEMETWMSMSSVMNEITRLCRSFAESFHVQSKDDMPYLHQALRTTAAVTIINCAGSERRRFEQCEIKNPVHFKLIDPFEFDDKSDTPSYKAVDYTVDKSPMSCYHPLHYILSWLLSESRSLPIEQIRTLFHFTADDLKQIPVLSRRTQMYLLDYLPSDNLLALFDFPIRLCSWLAQIRAHMWVRNGLSLRHQIQQYKSVRSRDLTYHRDIFMVQAAFVICDPATILTTMIDRFDLLSWVQGDYNTHPNREETQTIDVAEALVHLLIVILCGRIGLIDGDEQLILRQTTRQEIISILCYKPLSYTELNKHLTERIREEDNQEILQELTTFKAPEGLQDNGTFTLKEQYLEEIDPYSISLTRNQREESENLYRQYMAKKLGKDISDIVFEPKFLSLEGTLFKDLAAFTKTPVFAQMIFYFMQYCMIPGISADVQATKIEQLFQFVLHLTLVAVLLDDSDEDFMVDFTPHSFCYMALTKKAERAISPNTIVGLLRRSMDMEHLKTCTPRAEAILRHLQKKLPTEYNSWASGLNFPAEISNESKETSAAAARELKKSQALERQAKVMAQFKQQQDSFLRNQTLDWGVDDISDEEMMDAPEPEKVAHFPSGSCILCQEETDNEKLYGTFAFVSMSNNFRKTPLQPHHDHGWVKEVLDVPENLDRNLENRPFGYACNNNPAVTKRMADGTVVEQVRQELSKGFPSDSTQLATVSTGCGHIMHHSCYLVYMNATARRHHQQIARHHPEDIKLKQFLCPLCKALANAFLPIIWKPKTLTYPGILGSSTRMNDYVDGELLRSISLKDIFRLAAPRPEWAGNFFMEYAESTFVNPLVSSIGTTPLTSPVDHLDSFHMPGLPSLHFLNQEQRIMINPNDITFSEYRSDSQAQTPRNQVERVEVQNVYKVYEELLESLKLNGLIESEFLSPEDFRNNRKPDGTWPGRFIQSLGSTITAVEMGLRGVAAIPGETLLSTITSQALTHLRVLSDSIMSLITIQAINSSPNQVFSGQHTNARSKFSHLGTTQLKDLLSGEVWDRPQSGSLLLYTDSFKALANYTLCSIPSWNLDVKCMLKIFYAIEIAKTVAVFTKLDVFSEMVNEAQAKNSKTYNDGVISAFVSCVTNNSGWANDSHRKALKTLYQLIKTYAVVFLRKSLILMHVRYGIDFPPTPSEESEIARLSQLLLLPSLDELMAEAIESDYIRSILAKIGESHNIELLHPTIFELVGLPKTFDLLQEEVVRRRCPTTGRSMTDPALCLFCGEILCSQSMCCLADDGNGKGTKIGGCQQHRKE